MEQTQTTPKGFEIPVPSRKDFEDILDAVAKPERPEPSRTRRPKKERIEQG